MKVDVKDKSPVEKILSLEVEPERYSKALDKVIRKVSKNLIIPGFRRGKAPKKMVLRKVGFLSLKEDLLRELVPEIIVEALEQEGLEPLSTPVLIHHTVLSENEPISLKFQFQVKPEFELTPEEYKGLSLEEEKMDVDIDKMVELEIKRLQQQAGTIENLDEDRPYQEGDVALVDFESFFEDGTPVPNGSETNYYMLLDKDNFAPGFMDNIIGKKVGDEWEFKFKFPEDYVNKDLAGKEILFKMKAKGLAKKELPALDDEFAKSMGNYETFEDFKKAVRERVEESYQSIRRGKLQEQIWKILAEKKKDIPLPPILVDAHLNRFIDNLKRQLQMMGKSFEDYLKSLNTTLEEFKKKFKPEAEKSAIVELVLDKIAQIENIEVTEEDIDKEVEKVAKNLNQPASLVKSAMKRDNYINTLRYEIRNRKIFDVIIKNAEIKVVEKKTEKKEEPKDEKDVAPKEEAPENSEKKKAESPPEKELEEV